jgi:hypothetical protein
MIVFDQKHMGNHNHAAQYSELMQRRVTHNQAQKNILAAHGGSLDVNAYQKNEVGILTRDFWREVDNQAIEIRDNDQGREFLTDLMGIATPLNIGKTAKLYTVGTDISGEVARSMDGQTPFGYDQVDYETDGDPVPIFQGGYGVNWRHWAGVNSENVDLVLDSQRRKMVKILSDMADYVLDGDAKIKAGGFAGQGIRNHRNTKKVNVGAAGYNINLTTATADEIMTFFTRDFAKDLDDNYVQQLDVAWVSPEIMRRLQTPYSGAAAFKEGTLEDYIVRYGRIRSFRRTFKMSGNEFFGYVRSRDAITPLVGAAVATVPLPRTMPHSNYQFEIWGAMGLQIKADSAGRGSVFYVAALS